MLACAYMTMDLRFLAVVVVFVVVVGVVVPAVVVVVVVVTGVHRSTRNAVPVGINSSSALSLWDCALHGVLNGAARNTIALP